MFQTFNVTSTLVYDLNSPSQHAVLASKPIISDATYRQIHIILNAVSFIIFAVGLSTNLINSLVFSRQGLRDRMNLCLLYLSAVDLLYLASSSVSSFVTFFYDLGACGVGDEHYLKNVVYVTAVIYAFKATSGSYNVVIALERCLCVIFPLHATSCMTTRVMGIVLTTIAVVVQLGYTIIPLKYDIVSLGADSGVHWNVRPSKVFLNNKMLFDVILDNILGIALPMASFLAVLIATVITVIQLKATSLWRRQTSSARCSKDSQQTALTHMLIGVSCAYIVSMAPFVMIFITRLAEMNFSLTGTDSKLYLLCSMIVNLFPLANCSVNFFVYYCRSSRFRRALKGLFCRSYRYF